MKITPDNFDPERSEECDALMTYLHGDIRAEEREAALIYECGRASELLREAAAKRNELIQSNKWPVIDNAGQQIEHPQGIDETVIAFIRQKYSPLRGVEWEEGVLKTTSGDIPCTKLKSIPNTSESQPFEWIASPGWQPIWQLSSFPQEPWTALTADQRKLIMAAYSTPGTGAGTILWRIRDLDALCVFGRFKSKAAKADPKPDSVDPIDPAEIAWLRQTQPVIVSGSLVHALFTLNFTKSKNQLKSLFAKWLDEPDQKDRFNSFGVERRGTGGTWKTRLKDLAAARLADKLQFDGMNNFAQQHRLRDSQARPRPFHDAKKTSDSSRDQASVYSDERAYRTARGQIENWFRGLPWN